MNLNSYKMNPSSPKKQNKKDTRVHKIAENLRKEIMYGNFKPGEHLKEYHLAKVYKVSRVPIREAFRILHSEGYVEMIPNRGSFVKRVSREQVYEYYMVYRLLGPILLKDSVGKYKKITFKKAYAILDKVDKCKDFNKIGYLLWDYAKVIYGSSKYEFFLSIMDEIYKHNIRCLNDIFVKGQHQHYDTYPHRKFLSLCEKGETDIAIKGWFEYVDKVSIMMNEKVASE